MDAYCLRNYERNRARLIPYLLDGRLAAAGLLQLDELEAFLAKPVGRRDDRFYRLLPIVDTEAWARGWLGDPAIA
jgi:asparagine synthase (glutamine-hydrolysing)